MIEPNFNQKQELARDLIRYYLSARRGLTELGILRSERSLQSDYADWLAVELLALQLNTNPVEDAGATDRTGCTYHIRSHIVEDLQQAASFDFDSLPAPFDYLVGVLFSVDLDVLAVLLIPYKVVCELGRQSDSEFRVPWNRQTAAHPQIEKILWKDDSNMVY